MVKNLILDMGGVLLDFSPDKILETVCDTEEEHQVIYNELFCGKEWTLNDLGYIGAKEQYEMVKRRVPEKLHEKLRECCFYWQNHLTPVLGAKEFLKVVKEKYRLYVLSNAGMEFFNYFPEHYDTGLFDGIVVSATLHVVKPDEKIYSYLLSHYDLQAQECLFIDDRKENLEGAAKCGIHGRLFDGDFEQIKKELQL